MSSMPPDQLQSLMQSSMAASAALQQPQPSAAPALDRSQLEEMAEKMRRNPDMMRQAAETMKSMDPEVRRRRRRRRSGKEAQMEGQEEQEDLNGGR
eukprot:1783-Hanusia_phi.AAC.2